MLGLTVASAVYTEHGFDCVVTSLLDGRHSLTSLHYSGNAADLRTRHVEGPTTKQMIRDDIKEALGVDYDVVLESDHIHLEYQPRRK